MIPTEGTVLVDFYADWCVNCATIEKSLEEIGTEWNIKVLKLDLEAHRDVFMEHGVMSIPTVILFQDGEEVKRVVGAAPKHAMMAELRVT